MAGRGGEGRAAVQLDDGAPIDRVVERLPDTDVIEWGTVGVDRREVNGELWAGVKLGRGLQAELAVLCPRD